VPQVVGTAGGLLALGAAAFLFFRFKRTTKLSGSGNDQLLPGGGRREDRSALPDSGPSADRSMLSVNGRGDNRSVWERGSTKRSSRGEHHSFYVGKKLCACCFCEERREKRSVGGEEDEVKQPELPVEDETPDVEKFMARTMLIGKEDAAAHGIWKAIGIMENGPEHVRILTNGLREIEREFTTICGHCEQKDEERYRYIAEQEASHLPQDNGVQRDIGNEGKTLDDFLKHPSAVAAGLVKAHVLALRLYTSNSYTRLNSPFRWPAADGTPHPYAATVFWISDALKKLRAVLDPTHFPMTFYRGMKDMAVAKQFEERGGTEMACMSTSADKGEALKWAESRVPLLLQFEIENHMQCGADISWLSMYPEEKEWLFPPLTYLKVLKTSKTKSGEGKKRIPVYHIRTAIA
jgi:hypothetical protein